MRFLPQVIALVLAGSAWLYASQSAAAQRVVDRTDPTCNDTTGRPYCSPLSALKAAEAADTIVLKNGPYKAGWRIDKNLILRSAPNGKMLLEGDQSGPVITVAPGAKVELHGFVIRGGRAEEGAGILNRGTLWIDDCVIKENVAEFRGGGVFNGGSLSGSLRITNSKISRNRAIGDDPYNVKYGGGGIYNRGPLKISDSRIINNYAHDNGGGIYTVFAGRSQPTEAELMAERFGIQTGRGRQKSLHRVVDINAVLIERSTISENEGGAGGGIHVQGSLVLVESLLYKNRATNSSLSSGGAIFAHFDTYLTVANSVISGNEALFKGGGLRFFTSARGELTNVSIVRNKVGDGGKGAGLYVVPTTKRLTVSHSLLAGNTSGSRASDCEGTVSSGGFNLLASKEACQWQNAPGDLVGTGQMPIDPLLNADDQGLYTLSPHSPAVDAGDPSVCGGSPKSPLWTDFFAKPRPVDGNGDGVVGCDIGAIERQG